MIIVKLINHVGQREKNVSFRLMLHHKHIIIHTKFTSIFHSQYFQRIIIYQYSSIGTGTET